MPNPITADQLAAVLGDKCQHFNQDFRTMVLPYSDWDHIIACLREHEERAEVDHDAMCDRHWIAGAQFGWNAGSAGDSGSFQLAIKVRRRDLVEAAVEKAARNA